MWQLSWESLNPSEKFLLTHPVWDVTRVPLLRLNNLQNFYSHIPCGMWQKKNRHPADRKNFYSHIPCGMWHGSRWNNPRTASHFYSHIPCGMWQRIAPSNSAFLKFLLTHPVWDVTKDCFSALLPHSISTHTSRVGCDSRGFLYLHMQPISTHTSRVGCDEETTGP